jgi:hypothetical protein
MFTSEQKVRQTLTGSPNGIVQYPHEGPDVVRWLTGGTLPDAYVRFEQRGERMIARCSTCSQELGQFDASYGEGTGQAIGQIRLAYQAHCESEHSSESGA